MITFTRTSCLDATKAAAAFGCAREVAICAKDITGVELLIAMPVGGNPWRIRWTSHFANLGAMEAAAAKLRANPQYNQLVARMSDCCIAGATVDEVWRSDQA